MPNARVLVFALGLIVASSSVVEAQAVGPLSTNEMDRVRQKRANKERPPSVPQNQVKASPTNCDYYLFTKPQNKLPYTDLRLRDIARCSKAVKDAIAAAAGLDPGPEVNEALIKLRVSYKTLLNWIESKPPTPKPTENVDAWIEAKKTLDEVGVSLPKVLRKHDLFAQFSAALITGASMTDASQPETPSDDSEGSAEKPASPPAEDATGVGWVVFQSRHFGDESLRPVDISLGGRIGFLPVLNMVAPVAEDSDTPEHEGLTAVHQSAFAWNFAVQANQQLRGINAEVGYFGKGGSTTLMSTPKTVDNGADSFVAFPLDDGANATAWMWEAGVEFNMFDNRLEQIHAEKGGTSPQFQFVLAVRRDERFRGSGYEQFERPTGRLVFRLALDAIKVFDRRQLGEAAKPFTFGFAVEHERSLAGSGLRVPSATRFMLRGDINLLRAITGTGDDGNKAGAGEGEEESEPTALTTQDVSVDVSGSEPTTVNLGTSPSALIVSLIRAKVGDVGERLTPLPSLNLTAAKPSQLPVPPCTPSTLKLTLKDDVLTVAKSDWGQCSVSSVVLRLEAAN